MKYFSIDIETTGLNPEKHQILELGIIFEDTENPKDFYNSPKFRAIIAHDDIVGSPVALSMNKDLLITLSIFHSIPELSDEKSAFLKDHNILYPNQVSDKVFKFIKDNVGDFYNSDYEINVAGKNFEKFDKKFLEKLPEWNMKFHRRVIDPASMYMLSKDKNLPTLNECLERAGVEGRVDHTALGDAWKVIQVVREFLKK
ncbi:MAG: exonuclease domain-containing protein [bacterium]